MSLSGPPELMLRIYYNSDDKTRKEMLWLASKDNRTVLGINCRISTVFHERKSSLTYFMKDNIHPFSIVYLLIFWGLECLAKDMHINRYYNARFYFESIEVGDNQWILVDKNYNETVHFTCNPVDNIMIYSPIKYFGKSIFLPITTGPKGEKCSVQKAGPLRIK